MVLTGAQILAQRRQFLQRLGIFLRAGKFCLGDDLIHLDLRIRRRLARAGHFDQRNNLLVEQVFHQFLLALRLIQHPPRPVVTRIEIKLPRGQKRLFRRRHFRAALAQIPRHNKLHQTGHFGLDPQPADLQRGDLILQIIHG